MNKKFRIKKGKAKKVAYYFFDSASERLFILYPKTQTITILEEVISGVQPIIPDVMTCG